MEHKFIRNFDKNGVWTKESRDIRVKIKGEVQVVNMDDYAKEHGIELPDAKATKKPAKQVNIDIQEEQDADMEQQDDTRDIEIDGNGDSEG
tara:strand:+ start:8630 stop:8902 length:273 start_codon:yes stop_codon:yes gene_type:complete